MNYTLAEQLGGLSLVVLIAFIVDRIAAKIPNVLDSTGQESPVSGDPPASESGEIGGSGENTLDQAESMRAAPPRTNLGVMPDRGSEAARAPGRSRSLRHYNVWSGM